MTLGESSFTWKVSQEWGELQVLIFAPQWLSDQIFHVEEERIYFFLFVSALETLCVPNLSFYLLLAASNRFL